MNKLNALALMLAGLLAPLTVEASTRELSFEDRVAAQQAIERVYYSHQIGATRRFDEAVPRALLEQKVRNYLQQSAALDELWNTPVTAQALQRELGARPRHAMPERLLELHALGDDGFLIRECLHDRLWSID
jgi:hypothetical protein